MHMSTCRRSTARSLHEVVTRAGARARMSTSRTSEIADRITRCGGRAGRRAAAAVLSAHRHVGRHGQARRRHPAAAGAGDRRRRRARKPRRGIPAAASRRRGGAAPPADAAARDSSRHEGEPVRRQTTREECSEAEWSLAARLGRISLAARGDARARRRRRDRRGGRARGVAARLAAARRMAARGARLPGLQGRSRARRAALGGDGTARPGPALGSRSRRGPTSGCGHARTIFQPM